MRTPHISKKQIQKTDFAPSELLKNEEQDKRHRRDFSPTKPIKNSWEIKIESG